MATTALDMMDPWEISQRKAMGLDAVNNPISGYNSTGILPDWMSGDNLKDLNTTMGMAGTGIQAIGGLAGLYSNLWGDKADLFDEQIGMLRDQRKYNQDMIKNREEFKQNIGSGLASAFGSK